MNIASSQSLSNDLKQYLQLLWRWSWLLAVLAVLGGGIAYYQSTRQPKIYRASATVLIDNPQTSTDIYYSTYASERLTQTYSQMILQQPTLEGVIDELGLDVGVGWLQGSLSVSIVPDTQLLRISIEDTQPKRAADIVNSIGTVFAKTNAELQASRYAETKNSLETQMFSMDQQIQETSKGLDQLKNKADTDPKYDILLVQLETYRSLYQEILKEIVEAETRDGEAVSITSEPVSIEDQMANVESQITDISAQIEALGYNPKGPEYDILATKLTAYQALYQKLVEELVSADGGTEPGADLEAGVVSSGNSLSAQLELTAERIQELTEEINTLGGSTDGEVERDRLESNLALYRQTYANLVQSYEQVRLAEIQNTSRVDLVQPAPVPSNPIRPNMTQNTMLGALVGLMVGVGVAFLIEILDDTVKGPGDVANRMKLPVLGYIARMKDDGRYPVTAEEPRSPISEAFRSLRTNIKYASIDRPIYTLMVTSPTPQDGKSTVAANLAVVIAQMGFKVGLIDADLRKPFQHRIFDLSKGHGLSESLLSPDEYIRNSFKKTEVENLALLTTGDLPPNPSELIGSDKMLSLMRGLESRFDTLIIDTPPVMAVTDPVVLSTRVDGVIVVLRPGITKMADALHTVEQLRQVGANILGVVLNDVENKGARYSQYYQGYYYRYGKYYNYASEVEEENGSLLKRIKPRKKMRSREK